MVTGGTSSRSARSSAISASPESGLGLETGLGLEAGLGSGPAAGSVLVGGWEGILVGSMLNLSWRLGRGICGCRGSKGPSIS